MTGFKFPMKTALHVHGLCLLLPRKSHAEDQRKFGDRSASPPDASLIWGSSGHSGWIYARSQVAAVDAPRRAWGLWESNPRGPGASQAAGPP